ncbi:THAP domain-containing protein 1-like [Schistocerca serialis cubense]|uniref:THAP domain-containing protein 1-like n=1 Tax=Schistocerca serialis cubense TaxID=2023355 RepID=UPI00214F0F7E|nr:THAP domain-containing protein 1-like [Schistocerca serialis cubense]
MNICRANWQNTKATALCKTHFTPDQFEANRADGVEKLKPNAVPTIFCYRKPPMVGEPSNVTNGISPAENMDPIEDEVTTLKNRVKQLHAEIEVLN